MDEWTNVGRIGRPPKFYVFRNKRFYIFQNKKIENTRNYFVQNWLRRLVYLLLPEVSGIEEESNEIEDTVFKHFCKGKLQKFWQEEVNVIGQYIIQIKEELEHHQANKGAKNISESWERYKGYILSKNK